ncbi:MAG TPA: hypothetical protein VFJ43_11945 [Bacteroidia bacterium]|nr:hypothetical protein [Bacteroidia bacterium]
MGIAFTILALTAWIMALRDIDRSDFKNDSGTKWFWWVFFAGNIAMMFYYYFGIKQKVKKYKFIKEYQENK